MARKKVKLHRNFFTFTLDPESEGKQPETHLQPKPALNKSLVTLSLSSAGSAECKRGTGKFVCYSVSMTKDTH